MHVLRSWFARSEYETITFRHSGVVGFLTRVVDGVDLLVDANIALRVAFVADHAHRRRVDQIDIGAKFPSDAKGLVVSTGVVVYQHGFRAGHGFLGEKLGFSGRYYN